MTFTNSQWQEAIVGLSNAGISTSAPLAAVSTANSTTTPLLANAVYTGAGESSLADGSISVQVFSDQASATNGLVVRQSQDGTNWDTTNSYSVLASTPFQQIVNLTGAFFEIKYTNGTTNQGVFRLQTIKELGVFPNSSTVTVANANANGQATMSNSSPTVLASDQTALPIKSDIKEIIGSGTGVVTGTGTDFIPAFDMGPYAYASLQTAGVFSLTLTVEFSNDNATFNITGLATKISTFSSSSTITGVDTFIIPKLGRYLRIRCTAFTSNGSLNGNLECFTQPLPIGMAQYGTWTALLAAGTNNIGMVQSAKSNAAVGAGGTAAVVVKASAGYLRGAVVTATGSANLLIYDHASAGSGTVIGVIPSTATLGQYFPCDMPAALGITAQQASGSPAVTVAYG